MTKIQFNFPQLQREEAKLYFSKLIHEYMGEEAFLDKLIELLDFAN